jgi:DNA-binding NarL/FixJ family response regulator
MFSSRITTAAKGAGTSVSVVRTPEALAERLADGAPLALIDLEAEGAFEAIALCAAATPRPRTVAFGAHVDREALERARAAGADEALPRSAFVSRLPELL